jgi:D-glycero-D-manno-heptose 1,7-bisphosphate phosphatase
VLADVAQRLAAVRAFAALPESAALAAANKRIANILKKAGEVDAHVNPALLKEDAEKALYAALQKLLPESEAQFKAGDYTASLQTLAALRGPVDAFFDDVMVNAEEMDLRLMSDRKLKLVILDRDGTINLDRDDFVKSPQEWQPLPGSLEAIARLNHAGWHVAVASNQSGLGRGLFDMAALNAMHDKLHQSLAAVGGRIDAIFFCPHTQDEDCQCRKPLPGLFEQIGARFGVPLKGVPAVGDSLRDLLAGSRAGCQPHLVLTGKSAGLSPEQAKQGLPEGSRVHADLAAFADFLIERGAAAA